MMYKLLLLITTFLLQVGCATTANYEKILNTWVGSPVDNLVSSWGPPQGSFELSNGSKVIEYVRSRNVQMGGYSYSSPQTTYNSGTASAYGTGGYANATYSGTSTTYVQKQTPTYNVAMSCRTRFTISKEGIVKKWSWEGNDCKAMDPK